MIGRLERGCTTGYGEQGAGWLVVERESASVAADRPSWADRQPAGWRLPADWSDVARATAYNWRKTTIPPSTRPDALRWRDPVPGTARGVGVLPRAASNGGH